MSSKKNWKNSKWNSFDARRNAQQPLNNLCATYSRSVSGISPRSSAHRDEFMLAWTTVKPDEKVENEDPTRRARHPRRTLGPVNQDDDPGSSATENRTTSQPRFTGVVKTSALTPAHLQVERDLAQPEYPYFSTGRLPVLGWSEIFRQWLVLNQRKGSAKCC